MRLALIILSVTASLSSADCPAIFDGENITQPLSRVEGFAEVLETVCGKRNFTAHFWAEHFRDTLITHVAGQKAFDDLGPRAPNRPYKVLLHSVYDQLQSMNNSEAKAYVDAFIKSQNDFMNGIKDTLTGKKHPVLGFFQGIMQMIGNMFSLKTDHRLSVEAQIELTKALKRGFGYEETEEMKTARVETAMRALERIDIGHDGDRVALLFAQMYLLAKERSIGPTLTKEKTSFEEFSEWMDEEWNVTDASVLEIAPAVETLYLQYRTLRNEKAKAYVHGVLSTQVFMNTHVPYGEDGEDMPEALKVVGETLREDHAWDVYRVCTSRNALQCYQDLPDDAKTALASAFPELSSYLSTTDWFEKWMAKVASREVDESMYVRQSTVKPYRRFIAVIPKKSQEFALV